uniref:DMT family transporter n=1 Tax=Herbidospora sakaeratensis TaxID=564415 RepID=UPI000785BC19|nr:DMT family transporter [Herbidospora sakaeratensis]
MTMLAAAPSAAVALVGSLFFALGAALQQHVAATGNEPRLRVLLRRPRWLLGGAVIAAGGLLHVYALSIGPLTIVQPMGVASLLFALPIAAALHGRPTSKSELAAGAMVAIGLIALVLMVPVPTRPPSMTAAEVTLMLGLAGGAALICLAAATRIGPPGRTALLAVSAGIMYGAASTLMRVIADGWPGQLWFLLALPVPLVVALMLLQKAYAIGHFGVAFAALQVADPVTAVSFGALLLGEPLPANGLAATAAAALAAAGTVALARTTPLSKR